jgi:hypothetical protein
MIISDPEQNPDPILFSDLDPPFNTVGKKITISGQIFIKFGRNLMAVK